MGGTGVGAASLNRGCCAGGSAGAPAGDYLGTAGGYGLNGGEPIVRLAGKNSRHVLVAQPFIFHVLIVKN
jgi:hypothetical protein